MRRPLRKRLAAFSKARFHPFLRNGIPMASKNLFLLPGDGIGPEAMAEVES